MRLIARFLSSGSADDAAEAYRAERNKRMRMTKKEVEAKAALIAAMKKNKVELYRDDNHTPPLLVVLKPGKDGISVKDISDDGSEADTDGSEE